MNAPGWLAHFSQTIRGIFGGNQMHMGEPGDRIAQRIVKVSHRPIAAVDVGHYPPADTGSTRAGERFDPITEN